MKLESWKLFKKILLRFSYILVIYRHYTILLTFSCPMNEVKVGKLPIIACYTCNFISKYFKGAKIWWLFAQLYKNLLIVLCWKSRLLLDFKIRIIIASQEKENNILWIANEEMGATTFNSWYLKIWRGASRLLG